MTTIEFIDEIEETFAECLEIVKRKNRDYTRTQDPFQNFNLSTSVGVDPERGILVRVTDKICRISTLLSREPSVTTETIFDTLNDSINYLAILKAMLVSKQSGLQDTVDARDVDFDKLAKMVDGAVTKKVIY